MRSIKVVTLWRLGSFLLHEMDCGKVTLRKLVTYMGRP